MTNAAMAGPVYALNLFDVADSDGLEDLRSILK
jgi:hypothetical protein